MPAIEGISSSTAANPSHAVAAKARSPRATGGQRTATSAIRIGPMAARPTARSMGPPGR